jgi:hypothetical protein
MDPYDICSACSCFIKTAETSCPFCGAEHRPAPGAPVHARRMSRAQWLALGSALALTSCGGNVRDPGPTGTQGSGQHAGGDQSDAEAQSETGQGTGDDSSTIGTVDAGSDKDVTGDEDAPIACAVSPSTFACAGQSCNTATQYCYISYGGTEVSCQDDATGGYFPPQCLSCPTCECVSRYISGPSCKCVDLGGSAIGVQCAGCYGAPPTRLELLAA